MLFNGKTIENELEFTPVFIGGSGRSGTSVLHATICSDYESGNTNEYVGEIGYFMQILRAGHDAFHNYKTATYSYFNNEIELFTYHSNLIREILINKWEYLGKPKNLVLKAPAIWFDFSFITQFIPSAKFILTVRNPLDIVASMKTISQKQGKNYSIEELIDRSNNLNEIHQTMERHSDKLAGKLLTVKYEEFVTGENDQVINEFLDIEIQKDKIWQSSKFQANQGWLTDKYNGQRTSSSIGNYREVLNEAEIDQVKSICTGIIDKFGYKETLLS